MRLQEEQVKQAILNPDRDVREAAVYYFARSFSQDPGIMPLAIQAIEQYGKDDAFERYSFLKDLVQTDETVLWLIAQIKKQVARRHSIWELRACHQVGIRPMLKRPSSNGT